MIRLLPFSGRDEGRGASGRDVKRLLLALVEEEEEGMLALCWEGVGSRCEGMSWGGEGGSSPRDNEERLDAPHTAV